jgi:hypothetical protein
VPAAVIAFRCRTKKAPGVCDGGLAADPSGMGRALRLEHPARLYAVIFVHRAGAVSPIPVFVRAVFRGAS